MTRTEIRSPTFATYVAWNDIVPTLRTKPANQKTSWGSGKWTLRIAVLGWLPGKAKKGLTGHILIIT